MTESHNTHEGKKTFFVKWIIQDHVILLYTGSYLELEDNVIMNSQVEKLLNEVDHPVHLISDTSDLKTFPINIVKLMEIYSFLKHPNFEIGVQVTTNPMLRFLTRAITRPFRSFPFRIVASREEALRYLYSVDKTLESLPHSVD